MSKSISSATLARYFGGTATPEEQASVEAWIGDDPARQAAVETWRNAWLEDIAHFRTSYNADVAWIHLAGKAGLPTLVRDDEPVAARRAITPDHAGIRNRSRRRSTLRWAAAAAVVLTAGVTARQIRDWSSAEVADARPGQVHTTPRGQRGIVRLADGTEVMLNAASRLTVPATFGAPGQPRALELEGQAYFVVTHDDTRPFTVRTARGVTRDIGTRFDIRAYPDEPTERIAVTEGEVAVRSHTGTVETPLQAGQGATVSLAGEVALARDIDVERATAWTVGRLELDDVTLAAAARRLGRWYDLDVTIHDDDLARRRVVGSYGDETVAQVLGLIAAAVDARYERQGRSVVFFPRDGRSTPLAP